MLRFIMEQGAKSAKIVTAASELKTGAPLDDNFVADKQIEYDGINAVIEPKAKDNDTIAQGDLYLRIPVFKGDRLATDQVTVGTLTAGDPVVVSSGKFVADSAQTPAGVYLFQGEYENPFGVKMYIIERVKP